MGNVRHIRFAVGETVMRILLPPASTRFEVDIVPKSQLLAACQVWLFRFESRVRPIVVELHEFGDAHREYHAVSTMSTLASSTNYPVINVGGLSNVRLASGQCTRAKKRIRRESIVSGNDV